MPDLERVRRLLAACESDLKTCDDEPARKELLLTTVWVCGIAEAAADILDITLPQPGASLLATGIQVRGMFRMRETGCLTVSIEKLERLAEAFESEPERDIESHIDPADLDRLEAAETIEAMNDPRSVGNPAWLASRMQERAEKAEAERDKERAARESADQSCDTLDQMLKEERQRADAAEAIVNSYGGFHERTEREAQIASDLDEIKPQDRDPHDHAIADLLALLDAGRGRLWKAEEERDAAEALVRRLVKGCKDAILLWNRDEMIVSFQAEADDIRAAVAEAEAWLKQINPA